MSLKTLRWAVALITNHGCSPPATAAPTAAVPVIDGVLQDSPALTVPLPHAARFRMI